VISDSAAKHKISKQQQTKNEDNGYKNIRHKKCNGHAECDPE